MSKYVAGIDFGTSNSSAAISDGKNTKIVQLENDKTTIPTAIYIENHRMSFGRMAKSMYTGDVNPNARLIRSIKRILGTDIMNSGTTIDGRYFRYESIILEFIRFLKNKIDKTAGHNVQSVVIGRPVHFNDNAPDQDDAAEQTLQRIAHAAGFTKVSFQYEPVAAAYAHEQNLLSDKLAIIIDIGGGTSDFSVIKLSPHKHSFDESSNRILSSTGTRVGGVDFDKSLSLKSFMPHFGMGTNYMPRPGIELVVPVGTFHTLSTWDKINDLYNFKTTDMIQDFIHSATTPDAVKKLNLLQEIISQNLGHKNLDYVETVKISLSDRKQKQISLDFLESHPSITVLRDDFEISIEPQLNKIRDCANECLSRADVTASDIDLVIFTGGSTAIPYLMYTITQMFPNSEITTSNRMSSVGLGLAHDAAIRYLG